MDLKQTEYVGVDWVFCLQYGAGTDICEHGNESSGSMKGE